MWTDLVAVENNIHIRRREQLVTEILDRLISVTDNLTKRIERLVSE